MNPGMHTAPAVETASLLPGKAYVFARSGDSWIEEAKLTASDGFP